MGMRTDAAVPAASLASIGRTNGTWRMSKLGKKNSTHAARKKWKQLRIVAVTASVMMTSSRIVSSVFPSMTNQL
jgi:hypothetical protein